VAEERKGRDSIEVVMVGSAEGELTMPRANRAPRPRTTPYPQPSLRGGAIGILLD
jgi:hypothetical protein